jgi:Flp pilus assembly protein TadB
VTTLARRLSARTGTEAALRAFAADIADPAADRIAAALIIATGRRGGGVREVLNALAVMLARDVAARRDIEAERAVHRTTVRWIAVFVLAFTAFAVLNRSYSAPFGTVAGEFVLAFVAGLYALGLGWLHRLGTMPAPGRFLDPEEPAKAASDLAPAGRHR